MSERLVIEQRVQPVTDDEVVLHAATEDAEFAEEMAEALVWLGEHGYRVVRDA